MSEPKDELLQAERHLGLYVFYWHLMCLSGNLVSIESLELNTFIYFLVSGNGIKGLTTDRNFLSIDSVTFWWK